MARIEMRDCIFRVVDGHSNTAAVNKTTPLTGDTDINVDSLAPDSILPASARFTVVGSTRHYRITSQKAGTVATVTFTGASAGNITLKIGLHSTSANILFSATAAQVKAAIVATGVASADVTVVQSAGLWTLTFAGSLNKVATTVVATDVSLVGGSSVVAYTHTGGTTWNISFSPAFATADGVPVDDAVITIGGRTVEVKVGDGNFQYTESKEFTYEDDRGNLDTVREGKQIPMDVTFDFVWDFITGYTDSDNPTVEDAIKQKGEASDWISTSDDLCEPYCVDIEVDHVPPCSDQLGELFTFPAYRRDKLTHDMSKSQVSATGRCNAVEPIIARYAL